MRCMERESTIGGCAFPIVATAGCRNVNLNAVEELELEDTLDLALMLMEENRYETADSLLTWAIMSGERDPDLWLAAGLARLRRGALSSAKSAFRMCAWISGDPLAVELSEMSY